MAPKIVIKEIAQETYTSSYQSSDDIWVVIQLRSDKEGLVEDFKLELLLENWDMRKLESHDYKKSVERFQKIAEKNELDFYNELEDNLIIYANTF